MALIEKRGDLQWRARVRKKGYPEQSETHPTKAEAEAWASAIETDLRRGVFMPSKKSKTTTFKELADRYLEEITPSKRSAPSERGRIATLVKEFGAYFVANITREMVGAFRDKRLAAPALRPSRNAMTVPPRKLHPDTGELVRRKKGDPPKKGPKNPSSRVPARHLADMPATLSTQSVIHELNTLSVIIEHARSEWGIQLIENPAKVKRPKLPDARDRRVSEAELRWLYVAGDASDVPGLRLIIRLAVETGMRLGELVDLEWKLVDLENGTALLPRTKNGDSRSVPLSPAAIHELREFGKVRRLDDPRVFHWKASDSFQKTWKRCVGRATDMYATDCQSRGTVPLDGFLAGEDGLHFHDLRHEAASRFSELGLNGFEIAEILGHKTLAMTKRYVKHQAETLATKIAKLQAGAS